MVIFHWLPVGDAIVTVVIFHQLPGLDIILLPQCPTMCKPTAKNTKAIGQNEETQNSHKTGAAELKKKSVHSASST